MNRRRLSAALLLAALGLVLTPTAAAAHPLGNFTTNQYAGLRITAGGVDVDFVLDLAELPAYQAKSDEIDTNGDGADDQTERDRYATATCAATAAASQITIDGRVTKLDARAVALSFPPGAGGLSTLRLQCVLHAAGRPKDGTTIGFHGNYLPDRIGWREVTAVGDHFTLTQTSVPSTSISARLTAYPKGAPTSDTRTASLSVRPGGPAAAPFAGEQAFTAQARGADRLTEWFTDLVGHPQLTWGVGILAFLVAFVLGGAHAVAPGHGKTIMAAYLVGARGQIRHALVVAATVAATHTLGVLALGVLLATSLQLAPQNLYEWLRLASGILVAVVGAQLLRSALRGVRAHRAIMTGAHPQVEELSATELAYIELSHDALTPAEPVHADLVEAHHPGGAAAHSHPSTFHHHAPNSHDHGLSGQQAHSHEHEHSAQADGQHVHGPHEHGQAGEWHSHAGGRPHRHYLPTPDEPFRLRSLLAMGFAGGLSPSPSAVVVLLGAAALGRAWYGVLLVLAYGIGLAAVLTGIGLALARWGERLRALGSGRVAGLLTHRMPTVTAAAILAVGLGMAAYAVTNLLATNS